MKPRIRPLSPFERTPALPAANMAVLPLAALTVLAAVLMQSGLGVEAARHRLSRSPSG